MITPILAVAVCATLAQVQPPPRDLRPASGPSATAAIAGVVLSDEPQPKRLRRARVMLAATMAVPGRTTITGDDGTFGFDGLPPGRYFVEAVKDGYLTMSYGATRPARTGSGVTAVAGETQRITLRLPRGAVITGIVTDLDGQPAHGISVKALASRYSAGLGERRLLSEGVSVSPTDDRGVYRIFGLPAGEYVVTAQPQTRPPTGFPGGDLRTLSRGALSQKSITPAQVFHPGATDVSRATKVAVAAGEERGGVDIQLHYVPLATVAGSAPVAAGWTAASLTMVRSDETPGADGVRRARADDEGRFSFPGVPPGRYQILAVSSAASPVTTSGSPLIVTPANTLAGFAEIAVEGEDVTSLSLALHPVFTISGSVAFEGLRPPPPRVELTLSLPLNLAVATAGLAVPQLQVQSDGTFKVEGLVPGSYRMFGAGPALTRPIGGWWIKSLVIGGRDVLDAPLNLGQGADNAVLTLTDQVSEIAGSVTDGPGNPFAAQYVVAFSADKAAWFFNSRRVAGVRTDAQGRYAIRNLPPGDYRITAAIGLEQQEWFDPTVLERLIPGAPVITITGVERKTHDITIR